VSPGVTGLLDPRATERLVRLEIADIEVPSPPGVSFHPPLYFRILPLSDSALRIELWELGHPYGVRSVSTLGSDNLRARRISLAAAELARRLRQERLSEIARAARIGERGREDSSHPNGFPIYAHFAWSAGAKAASIGTSDAWLVGPAMDATLKFSSGPRLTLGAAWLAGKATTEASESARWLEGSLSVAQAIELSPSVELDLGLDAAIASVRLSGRAPSEAASNTWSSRAGAFARVETRLGRHVALSFGPDLGVLLRPLELSDVSGPRHVAGPWLGGTVSLSIDPSGF
jgi:hypothetical protein